MGVARLQRSVTGSKMVLSGIPLAPTLGSLFPPEASIRPSGRRECPEQKITDGVVMDEKLPSTGFHTVGVPDNPKESTFPVGSTLKCTATLGQVKGALH
jgi:hypothetical protein